MKIQPIAALAAIMAAAFIGYVVGAAHSESRKPTAEQRHHARTIEAEAQ